MKKELDAKVEQLLLKKSYEQLTPAEREYVTPHLSMEEYNSFYAILQSAREQSNQTGATLDPTVQPQLLQRFRQAHRSPSFMDRIWQTLQHPIPSWQVGLACLLLSGATYFFTTSGNPTNMASEQIHEPDAQVTLTSRSAEEERELLVLLTGVR